MTDESTNTKPAKSAEEQEHANVQLAQQKQILTAQKFELKSRRIEHARRNAEVLSKILFSPMLKEKGAGCPIGSETERSLLLNIKILANYAAEELQDD